MCKERFVGKLFFLLGWMLTSGICWQSNILPAQSPVPMELSTLPPPPDREAELIELGRVTFESGPRDPVRQPTSGPRITAETQYRIAYHFDSRSKWTIKVDPGTATRQVRIGVRYFNVQLQPEHVIWMATPPPAEDFWSDRLVQHELDHVRISSDKRLQKQFEQRLRAASVFERVISNDQVVNRDQVNRWVDEHVAAIFAEISELVAIRYQELDRLTSHGLRPLPATAPLAEILDSTHSRGSSSLEPSSPGPAAEQ